MSGHVIAAAEAAARLKLETYESTFEVEAPGTGRLGVAFRDSSELWTVTPGGALHRLGVYPGCLLLRANGRPCGATDGSALQALEAAAADGEADEEPEADDSGTKQPADFMAAVEIQRRRLQAKTAADSRSPRR